MICTVSGKDTVDLRCSLSPGAGGDKIVKETSPEATASVCTASGMARMYSAKKPDQGQRTSLCSKLRLSSLPASFVGVKVGSSSKVPVRQPAHCCRDTPHSQASSVGVTLVDGQNASERLGSNMPRTPQRTASYRAGRAKAGLDVAPGGQHSDIKHEQRLLQSNDCTHL